MGFFYCERILESESSNLIIYYAGPLEISISGWTELITIKSKNEKWNYLLTDCLEAAKQAWNVKDEAIVLYKDKIEIKYNFEMIKLYIEHYILFN